MPYSDPQKNKDCISRYAKEHADEIKGYKHEWYLSNTAVKKGTLEYRLYCAEKSHKWRLKHDKVLKERAKERKLKVIQRYGGQCACCKEDLIEFLTIDHVNGGGRADRGNKDFYRSLLSLSYLRNDLRVLCMNCNWAVRFGGKCPHAA